MGKSSFQSTPPRGRRHFSGKQFVVGQRVSIHASAWEAAVKVVSDINPRLFQSTPPRGRRRKIADTGLPRRSFNPRLRVGGGDDVLPAVWLLRVSIHASAWEAGQKPTFLDCGRCVSIHASAWEAAAAFASFAQGEEFQSTPPRGRRGIHRSLSVGASGRVSIHASAWEAAAMDGLGTAFSFVSIHASAWEAVVTTPTVMTRKAQFQSTPPRGRRARAAAISSSVYAFQSTPPRGRRLSCPYDISSTVLFQSTPPRGRRRQDWADAAARLGFQSTPPRGRRQITVVQSQLIRRSGFNPRLRVGGGAAVHGVHAGPLVSIHASAWEAGRWPALRSRTWTSARFNPRLRVGGGVAGLSLRA